MSFMRCHVLGRHVLHGAAHLVDHLLHQLVAQLVHQLVEALLGLGRLEVVGVELAHLAGEVVGQQVEAHVAIVGGGLRVLGAALVAASSPRRGGRCRWRGAPRRRCRRARALISSYTPPRSCWSRR